MTDKYTIRDFFAYLLIGIFLLLTLLFEFKASLFHFFQISQRGIKDNPATILFLLIPGLYLLGHIVHGVDLIITKIGMYIWDFKKKSYKSILIKRTLSFLNFVVNGYRQVGILNSQSTQINNHISFRKKVCELQYEGKYSSSEYWNLMNELFKGLTLITFGWSIYYLTQCILNYSLIYFLLTCLFWYRARFMVVNYVSMVNNTYNIISTP
ncbi:hypothetical protein [Cytophaga hutchinsonii]|uniref:Uncharacterized protein n=1 Tax=Cytophaga hutchinsonii (strain ATCC 33406 / DSM 1761 / CIP 103989 / NBRC 15051 / NCIMB 9469 / D465) TaxID=269798 RepID=A0A6N4SQ64_CYTH3|nr:hypothetical protein [Cytophaga hutchinsonii]ABG58448.1 hypothetical protein CHU_1173 [Cytophaga hutchinsonii ATCC 33406]SFX74649.1 hypothetical protein SAMN04487930_10914 [Cytophaga hutchinsonii ATCC 33406]